MKVKLKGALFTNPMDYNHIYIHEDMVEIHNSNKTGYGFMVNLKNPTLVPDGFEFTLNKKDYGLIAGLNEFYLEKKKDVIYVFSDHFRGKFSDMKESLIKPILTDIDMVEIGVPFDALYCGRVFAEKPDNARMQYGGITIHKDRIVASDTFCVYQKDIVNTGTEINIPKEIFKYLGKKDYTIKTNGRCVLFQIGESAFYSEVIDTLVNTSRLDDTSIVEFTTERSNFLEKLKVIKEYSNDFHMSVLETVLTLSTSQETNELQLSIDIIPKNISKLEFTASVAQMIKMISMVEDEEVTLKFNQNMVKVCWNKIVTASARIRDRNEFAVEGVMI